MGQVAIRAPSVAALFDAWSPEPLDHRPLASDVRERIVDAWLDERKRDPHHQAGPLVLVLPAADERAGRADAIRTAIRTDMTITVETCRHHWLRRALRPRQSRLGFLIFAVSLLLSAGINYGATDAWTDTVAQTFVVIAWVALWDPAQVVFEAARRRLARKHYAVVAAVDVQVRWDPEASV
jgi:hypothetical protein